MSNGLRCVVVPDSTASLVEIRMYIPCPATGEAHAAAAHILSDVLLHVAGGRTGEHAQAWTVADIDSARNAEWIGVFGYTPAASLPAVLREIGSTPGGAPVQRRVRSRGPRPPCGAGRHPARRTAVDGAHHPAAQVPCGEDHAARTAVPRGAEGCRARGGPQPALLTSHTAWSGPRPRRRCPGLTGCRPHGRGLLRMAQGRSPTGPPGSSFRRHRRSRTRPPAALRTGRAPDDEPSAATDAPATSRPGHRERSLRGRGCLSPRHEHPGAEGIRVHGGVGDRDGCREPHDRGPPGGERRDRRPRSSRHEGRTGRHDLQPAHGGGDRGDEKTADRTHRDRTGLPSAHATLLANLLSEGVGPEWMDHYPLALAAVGSGDVVEAALHHLDPAGFDTVVVGNATALAVSLADVPGITVRRFEHIDDVPHGLPAPSQLQRTDQEVSR